MILSVARIRETELRKLIMICVVATLVVLSASSEGTSARSHWMSAPSYPASSQFGVASWYGPGFQGRPTASGPPYNMNAMTCAHRELPLGTTVRVTDLLNSRSVVLEVNDRGPFVDGRVLDVSRAAAEYLGFRYSGLAPVRIEVVSYPGDGTPIPPGREMAASATGPADRWPAERKPHRVEEEQRVRSDEGMQRRQESADTRRKAGRRSRKALK